MSLPPSLERTPALDRWLTFNEDGSISVRTGKVELGQGITTAIAMIAAEELNVNFARIRVQTADTNLTPNELVTAGSMSVEQSGAAIRVACATARERLLTLAAETLRVPRSTLEIEDGILTSIETNEQTDYWSLLNGERFHLEIKTLPPLKHPHDYKTVGRRHPRVDIPNKVQGNVAFVHDMQLPHMRYGRLVKPPVVNARLEDAPEALEDMDVQIVRDGSFLGVIADREEVAARAAERLAGLVRWDAEPLSPLPPAMPDHLRSKVTRSLPVVDGTPVDEPVTHATPPESAWKTLSATYYRPYQMHAAMGPSAAVAQYMNGLLTVYSHSQGIEVLKGALADALQLSPDQIHVIHAEGAGCYGHNGADDVAMDAALLALAAEPVPVKVCWTRAEEHGFEPYGPATLVDMKASLSNEGRILDWGHETFGFSHIGRPRPTPGHSNLLAAWWRDPPATPAPREPALFPEVGIHRNLQPIYDLPSTHLVKHFVADSPLRTSSLRSLGAFANVFAIESFMDELAHAAERDPIEFRLAHLTDRRARAVLEALRDRAPPEVKQAGHGRGIAMARYKNRQTWCAILVDLVVGDDATVRLDRSLIVADAGLVIDPDGLINQLEGGFVQAASWALKEEVLWDVEGVTTRDWETYPILTFPEIPEIETHLLDRPLETALGAGEASTGPTPGAIANAIFDATGIRVRHIPFTPDRIRAAAAGAES